MRLNRGQAPAVLLGCASIWVGYLPVVGIPVVLGDIGTSTGASTAQLQWVTSSALLAMAITVLSAGAIARTLSRRSVLMTGFALVAFGSCIGAASGAESGARALAWIDGGQALIGAGGGALLTSSLALVSEAALDQHQRTLFISVWASSLVLGAGSGPFVSSAMTAIAGWSAVFLPLAIVSSVLLPVTATVVRPGERPSAGIGLDIPGQISAAAAITALVYGIIQAPAVGWTSGSSVLTFIAALLALTVFVLVERAGGSDALVPLVLFRSMDYVVAALGALMNLFAMVGLVFVTTLFLGKAHHDGVFAIASKIGVLFVLAALAGPATARLHRRYSSRVLLVAGLAVAAAGVDIVGSVGIGGAWLASVWPLAIFGTGVGIVMCTVSSVAIHAAPPEHAGMAGATNILFRQVGAALGPSVIGTVLASRLQVGAPLTDAFNACTKVIAVSLAVTALIASISLLRPDRQP